MYRGTKLCAAMAAGGASPPAPRNSNNKQKNWNNFMIKVTYRFSETENKRIMEIRVFGLLVFRSTRQFIIFGQGEHMEW